MRPLLLRTAGCLIGALPMISLAALSDNGVSLGIGYLDRDDVRIADRAGLKRDGLHALGDFHLTYRLPDSDGAGYWELAGSNLTLGSRALDLRHGHQGRYRLRIEYRELETRIAETTASPFRDASGPTFELPGNWQPAATTRGMERLEQSLQAAPLGTRRRTAALRWGHALDERWGFDGSLRRETRKGTRPLAGTIGNTGGNARAALLPAPLDFTTQDLELGLDYARAGMSLRSGYRLSVFDNGDRALVWDNPFAGVAGWVPAASHPAGQGQLALEPDSRQHQWFSSGAWRARPDLRFSGEFLVGQLRQDEGFLPYTINPAIDLVRPLPRTALDGRVDTTRLELRALYDPRNPFSGGFRYRYDDRDNRSPRDLFVVVSGDSRNQDAMLDVPRARMNLPYGFRRESLNAHGAWRWRNGVRLQGEAQRLETSRDFSEVEETRDDRLQLRLGGMAGAGELQWHVRGAVDRRSGDDYRGDAPWLATHTPEYVATVEEDLRFANHPLLRRYHLADRDRREYSAGLQWQAQASLTLGLTGTYRLDDYANSRLGLTEARARTVAADLGWAPAEGHRIDVWLARDAYDSEQDGQSFRGNFLRADLFDPRRSWQIVMRDRIDTAGLAWRREQLRPGTDVGVDYLWSLGRTGIDTRTGAALDNAPIPDTVSRIQRFDLYVHQTIAANWSVRAGWLHERGRISDWAFADTGPATVANVLGLGEIQPAYRVNWLTLRLNYLLR